MASGNIEMGSKEASEGQEQARGEVEEARGDAQRCRRELEAAEGALRDEKRECAVLRIQIQTEMKQRVEVMLNPKS